MVRLEIIRCGFYPEILATPTPFAKYPHIAPRPGLEPGLVDSESTVLPLDDLGAMCMYNIIVIFPNGAGLPRLPDSESGVVALDDPGKHKDYTKFTSN